MDNPPPAAKPAKEPLKSGSDQRLVRHHNHVWREGPSCSPLKSKDALLTAIAGSKSAGRWLRGEEIQWGEELESEGKVTLCCDGQAATSLPNDQGLGRRPQDSDFK